MIEGRRREEEADRRMVETEKKEESELNAYHEFANQLAFAVPAFFHAWLLFFHFWHETKNGEGGI